MIVPIYSWVIPVRDEAESLLKLFAEIKKLRLKNLEIIVVDDASTDDSFKILQGYSKKFSNFKTVSLKTHKGKWEALRKGFEAVSGQIIITSDSDLQDEPKEVLVLLKKINAGFDLVSGIRKNRQDLFYKVWISGLGNFLVSLVYRHKFYDLNSAFKVYRREVLDSIPKQGSLLRFSMLFAYLLGFKVVEVGVRHRRRKFGKSKFGIVKYARIIYDLVLVMLLFSGSGKMRK